MEHKLADIRRAHEALILEKGDTTNRLAQALEKSQAQCRNLMATNNDQKILQLQAQIEILSQEKEDMLKNIQDLQVIIMEIMIAMRFYNNIKHINVYRIN